MWDIHHFNREEFGALLITMVLIIWTPLQTTWNKMFHMSAFPALGHPDLTDEKSLGYHNSDIWRAWLRFHYIEAEQSWVGWTALAFCKITSDAFHIASFYILFHQYEHSTTPSDNIMDNYMLMMILGIFGLFGVKFYPFYMQMALYRNSAWAWISGVCAVVTMIVLVLQFGFMYSYNATMAANLFIPVIVIQVPFFLFLWFYVYMYDTPATTTKTSHNV